MTIAYTRRCGRLPGRANEGRVEGPVKRRRYAGGTNRYHIVSQEDKADALTQTMNYLGERRARRVVPFGPGGEHRPTKRRTEL